MKADMAKLAASSTPPKPTRQVADPKRFADAEYVRSVRHYTMTPGQTIDDVKSPGFFKSLATKFNLGDHLEVRSSDLTLWSLLMVVASDHIAAHVEFRTLIETRVAPADRNDFDSDAYSIVDSGDVMKRLTVVRKADGKEMRDGFASRQDAQRYITTELSAHKVS
jgi:hypothetical protein